MDAGLSIARLVFGLLLAVHGGQKLFGRWWTPQVTAIVLAAGVVGGFASLGLRRPAPAVART